MTCAVVTRSNGIVHHWRGADKADFGISFSLAIQLCPRNLTLSGFGIFGRVNIKGASTGKARRRLKVSCWIIGPGGNLAPTSSGRILVSSSSSPSQTWVLRVRSGAGCIVSIVSIVARSAPPAPASACGFVVVRSLGGILHRLLGLRGLLLCRGHHASEYR